jgi:hypothetical protein
MITGAPGGGSLGVGGGSLGVDGSLGVAGMGELGGSALEEVLRRLLRLGVSGLGESAAADAVGVRGADLYAYIACVCVCVCFAERERERERERVNKCIASWEGALSRVSNSRRGDADRHVFGMFPLLVGQRSDLRALMHFSGSRTRSLLY